MAKIKIFNVERDYYKVGEKFVLNGDTFCTFLDPFTRRCDECAFRLPYFDNVNIAACKCTAPQILCMAYNRPDGRNVVFRRV